MSVRLTLANVSYGLQTTNRILSKFGTISYCYGLILVHSTIRSF